MLIEYSRVLPFPREQIWKVLMDPDVLARVLPGIEKFTEVAPDKYSVVVKLGVPSVRGTYSGSVEVFDKQEPASYRMRGEGKGGPGWARGDALITLTPEGSGTNVAAKANAVIGGPVAGVGQRMMEGIAKAMAGDFFASIEREMQGRRQKKVGLIAYSFRIFLALVRNLFGKLIRRRAANVA